MATNAQYNYTTATIDAPMVFNIVNGGNQSNAGTIFASVNNEAGVDSQLTLDLGEVFFAEGPPQTGHLAVYNGTEWVGSNLWRKGSTGTGVRILKLLTSEALALHVRPIERYNGEFIGSQSFGRRLVFESAAYLRTGGTFTARMDEWDGELYAIQRIRTAVTDLPDIDVLELPVISGSSTTVGVSPNDFDTGRVAGMIIDSANQALGPFQEVTTGGRVVGTLESTDLATFDRAAIVGMQDFVDAFSARVTADGGTLEAATCVSDAIKALSGTSFTSLTPATIESTLEVKEETVLRKATTIEETLGVTGASTLGTLNAGASTLSSASVTGNQTVGGTLGVTGASNLSNANVSGAANFNGTASVNGAWYADIEDVTATASGTYEVASTDYILFTTWSGGNGTFTIALPPVESSEGRMIRIKTDSTISNSKAISIVPNEGDTGVRIDGETNSSMTRSYDGATYLCHSSEWWVIQKKDKG